MACMLQRCWLFILICMLGLLCDTKLEIHDVELRFCDAGLQFYNAEMQFCIHTGFTDAPEGAVTSPAALSWHDFNEYSYAVMSTAHSTARLYAQANAVCSTTRQNTAVVLSTDLSKLYCRRSGTLIRLGVTGTSSWQM